MSLNEAFIRAEADQIEQEARDWGATVPMPTRDYVKYLAERPTIALLNDLIRFRATSDDPVAYANERVEVMAIKREVMRRVG